MHEIEIEKIAAFSDIQFSTKNPLLFGCSVCKFNIRSTFMENEIFENVRPTLRGLFWVLLEKGEGKFTTSVVS